MSKRIHENKLKKDLYKQNTIVSKNLKFLRLICGYSQQEISDLLCLSRGAYFKIESGGKMPDFEALALLADFYKVNIDYLVSYDICAQVLNMIRGDNEMLKATTFLERFFSLSRSGKEQIKSAVFEMAEYEKGFKCFPWGNKEYDSLYETGAFRDNRFLNEKRFSEDIKL